MPTKHTNPPSLGELSSKESEFQPWVDEFKRWNELIVTLSEVSVMVKSGELNYVEVYYGLLTELYCNCYRPLMEEKFVEQWDVKESDLSSLFRDWKLDIENGIDEVPLELLEGLQNFHKDILVVRQKVLKVGIPLTEKTSGRTRIARALLGN